MCWRHLRLRRPGRTRWRSWLVGSSIPHALAVKDGQSLGSKFPADHRRSGGVHLDRGAHRVVVSPVPVACCVPKVAGDRSRGEVGLRGLCVGRAPSFTPCSGRSCAAGLQRGPHPTHSEVAGATALVGDLLQGVDVHGRGRLLLSVATVDRAYFRAFAVAISTTASVFFLLLARSHAVHCLRPCSSGPWTRNLA